MKKSFALFAFAILLMGFVSATEDSCAEDHEYIMLGEDKTLLIGDQAFSVGFVEIDEAEELEESLVVVNVNGESYDAYEGDEFYFGEFRVKVKDIGAIEDSFKIKVQISEECEDDYGEEYFEDSYDVPEGCVLEDAVLPVGHEELFSIEGVEYFVEVVSVDYSSERAKVLFVVNGVDEEIEEGEFKEISDDLYINFIDLFEETDAAGVVVDHVKFYLKKCGFESYDKEFCEDSDGDNPKKQGYVKYSTEGEDYAKTWDECSDDYTVTEYYCEGNEVARAAIECDEGYSCYDGACYSRDKVDKKEIENYEKKNNDYGEEMRDKVSEIKCSSGCVLEGVCAPLGYRHDGKYCDITNEFVAQSEGGLVCENNFECLTNVCVDGECIEQGFFRKLISWLGGLFG